MDERDGAKVAEDLTEERLEEIRRRRFQERLERVVEVMRRERIGWRGVAFIGADGRIGVRVAPVEVNEG